MISSKNQPFSLKSFISNKQLLLKMVLILIALGWLLYQLYAFGVRSGHIQIEQDRMRINKLTQTVEELRADLDKERREKIFAQRHQQIQEEAYRQMNKAYAGAEQENRYLESRLDFYRSIISPPDGNAGPAIQGFNYELKNGQLEFEVILIQSIKHKHQVRGELLVELYQQDKLIKQWPASGAASVNYQYFQKVNGVIENFRTTGADRILLTLKLREAEPLLRWHQISFDPPNPNIMN
jgi:hypothetical protein